MPQNPQVEEQILTQWVEPEQAHNQFSARLKFTLVAGGVVLSSLIAGAGYWLHEFSFYVAAAVVLMGVAAMFSQNKRPIHLKTITITNQRIAIDAREIPLTDLAGFWLQQEVEGLVVMLEYKKSTLIPVSFFFATESIEAAKRTLLPILPELEPRASHFTDRFSSYFRI